KTKFRIEDADSWREFRGHLTAAYGVEKTDESIKNVLKDFNKTRSISLSLYLPLWDWGRNNFQVSAVKDNLKINELVLENNRRGLIVEIRQSVREVKVALAV
ncbi:TolC family protein, partial [candidate division KSB1 bacterium]